MERGVTLQELKFPSFDGLEIYGHLSAPAGAGPFPAVVVLTGNLGGAKDEQGNYVKIAEHRRLVPRGYAVFTVDHRGTPGHGDAYLARKDLGGNDLRDALAATRYLSSRQEIDPDRIAILGGSRGAFLGALAIEQASYYRAAVLLMGFYDLERFLRYERAHRGEDSPFVKHFAAPWEQIMEALPARTSSPIHHVDQVDCAVMLIHGQRDAIVPPDQSRLMHGALRKAGRRSQLVLHPQLDHEYPKDTPLWDEIWEEVIRFLDRELQPGRSSRPRCSLLV